MKVGIRELSTRRPKIKREKSVLCKECKVQDYGSCPNLIALHDNGYVDPPVKRCLWKDFFDNCYDRMKEESLHSVKWGARRK